MKSQIPVALAVVAGLSIAVLHGAPGGNAPRVSVGDQPGGGWLVPTNQMVTPIGTVRTLNGGRPKDMALSPDGRTLAVLATDRVALYGADGSPVAEVPVKADPLGIAWSPDGTAIYASGTEGNVFRITGSNASWKVDGTLSAGAAPTTPAEPDASSGNVTYTPNGQAVPTGRAGGDPQVTGLAVSPDGRTLYAALSIRNAVAVLDLATGKVTKTVPVGVCPFRILLSPDGGTLLVANRGGQLPKGDEASALSVGTPTRIDTTTDASLRGSLSIVDTKTLRPDQMDVGRQPSGMALSADGRRLYVANSDEDTVSEVDIPARKVLRSVDLQPSRDALFGQLPMDVTLSVDGRTLYVPCSGANAVAVVRLPAMKVDGYVPTGWGPISVRQVSGALAIASSKGEGSRWKNEKGVYGVHRAIGTVQFIADPDQLDLKALSRKVAANNRWAGRELPARKGMAAVPVPERVGEPSVFKHVVYIIKENHTYDIDLGDIPQGNGDPSLVSFGEEVTPNEHAIARQFVLLDNTYSSGTNSAEGHQWTDSAISNGYMEQTYNTYQRSYGSDDPLVYSPKGFLWTSAIRSRVSLKVYGEGGGAIIRDPATGKRPSWTQLWEDRKNGTHKYEVRSTTDKKALKPYMHPSYITFPQIVSDQWRADTYLQDLAQFEKSGTMPALSIVALPNNHTSGSSPGMPRPASAVADNDLALGRIVQGLSHSRFWKDTLILVIEDDSQFGVDHVDGHRTVAFCISPYTKRGAVVSVPYNHTSLVRTMELVLGLPAMNRFDRTATPMTDCFTDKPDLRPYTHQVNRTPLDQMNPPASALRGEARRLARASNRQDFSDVDRADFTVLARAAWLQQNPGRPFPWKHFHPPAYDQD